MSAAACARANAAASGNQRHTAMPLAADAVRPATQAPKSTPAEPPPAPCDGLPARRACLEPFVAALEAFAFPKNALRAALQKPEEGDACVPAPELDFAAAFAIVSL